MILTPDLVFIHHPKTGGTFVTEALRRLYAPASDEDTRPGIIKRLRPRSYRDINKHGTCNDIPRSHRDKPILGCIRNPFDRYVSQYEFAYWKHSPRPEWDIDAIRERVPQYPDISFAEYFEIANASMRIIVPPKSELAARIGIQTEQFVLRYFHRPREIIHRFLDDQYIASGAFRSDMYDVRFLRTDHLNQDLRETLADIGLPAERIRFIDDLDRIFPPRGGRGDTKPWERYYDAELLRQVREREALLFTLFPAYDEAMTA
jgi:hypothetical protein